MPGQSDILDRYEGTVADGASVDIDIDLAALGKTKYAWMHITITCTRNMAVVVAQGRSSDAFASLPHPGASDSATANVRIDLQVPLNPSLLRTRINLANASGSDGDYIIDVGLVNE